MIAKAGETITQGDRVIVNVVGVAKVAPEGQATDLFAATDAEVGEQVEIEENDN